MPDLEKGKKKVYFKIVLIKKKCQSTAGGIEITPYKRKDDNSCEVIILLC